MLNRTCEMSEDLRDQPFLDRSNHSQLSLFCAKNESSLEKQSHCIQNVDDDLVDEDALKKKNQSKLRYRRLKQKLTMLCEQHQEKCLIRDNKEVSSPNKSRLLTLAIEFEKMTLNQTKDYFALESKLKQIQKILDHKREHDLLILKQSRLIPAFSSLLKKVPSFHKTEFSQSLKTVELGLKILRVFCTLLSNRDYMISTNQLAVLNSCLSSFIVKEQRKMAIQCLGVLNQLFNSRIKADSQQIVSTTLQIVFFGQLARKLRLGIESCITEDGIIEEQYVLKSLQYLYVLQKKCLEKSLEKPTYQQNQLPQIMQFHSDNLISFLYSLLPGILLEKDGTVRDEELPICIINITLYILKLLNLNLHVNLVSGQKTIEICDKNEFTKALGVLFQYSEDSINNNQQQLHELNCICSQIIEFLGKITCHSEQNKKLIGNSFLIELLFNHPLVYIMDHKHRSILIPSLCSVMNECEGNMKKYLSESSADAIINYISTQKRIHQESQAKYIELQVKQKEKEKDDEDVKGDWATLTRKESVSSMNSYTTECTQNSNMLPNQQQKYSKKLINLVPYPQWGTLVDSLKRLDN